MNFIKLNPMQLLWIKIYQIDAWHSSYPFVLEFKLFSLKFLNNPNSLCTILQIFHWLSLAVIQSFIGKKRQKKFIKLNLMQHFMDKKLYQVKSDAIICYG